MRKSSQNLMFLRCIQSLILFIALGLSGVIKAETTKALQFSAKNSEVGFSGEHAGMSFNGIFEQWNAELVLPPSSLPKISATFVVSSAKTGNSTYDSTLPTGDWFDVNNHPVSQFNSTEIIVEGKDYKVNGELTLRGISRPVTFLLRSQGNQLTANFNIDRLAHNIGMESDPSAEWVSQHIRMKLSLKK
jgi:polyisoprenoid-binding protein YceI